MLILDRSRHTELLKQEEQLFHQTHPKSYEVYQQARKSLHGGVPMLWMVRWAGSFPVFVRQAKGARFSDVDYPTKIFREALQSLFV